jgi:hypothetical protein
LKHHRARTLASLAAIAIAAVFVVLALHPGVRADDSAGTGGPPACVAPLVVEPPFDATYSCVELGVPVGVPPSFGGLTFLNSDPNTILIGGEANDPPGALYSVPIRRDASNHIVGFAGDATRFADAAYNDGGVVYGPGGVLFLARWPQNEIGQTRPGSTATDKIVSLAQFIEQACSSVSALNFVPFGYPGAGQLKLVTWSPGCWYSAAIAPDGSGTYDVTGATHHLDITGGPEGFIYVPPGSPQFTDFDSLLVSEYSGNAIATYELDGNGDPIAETRRTFISGLDGAEGAAIDPVTGDFLFSTFGGNDRVVAVRGFAAPPPAETPTPSATVPSAPTSTQTVAPATATVPAATVAPASATRTATVPAPTRTATRPRPTPTRTRTPRPSTEPAVFRIDSSSVPTGGEGGVDLQALDLPAPGLGSWTIDIEFDPDILAPVQCRAFGGSTCSGVPGEGGAAGSPGNSVRIAGANATGILGDVRLATVRFECRAEGASRLRVLPISVLDIDGNAFPADADKGTLTCFGEAPPPPTPTSPPPVLPSPTPTRVSQASGVTQPPQATSTPVVLTPTPTLTPVEPTPTRTSEVLGEVAPTPSGPSGEPDSSNVGGGRGGDLTVRPETTGVLAGPDQVSTNVRVIVTNLLLAIIMLVVLLVSSTLFNDTLSENRVQIQAFWFRITKPFRRIGDAFRAFGDAGGGSRLLEFAVGGAILLLIGLVYTFNESDVGFNDESLLLFLSVVIGAGIITYVYEGGEVLMTSRRFDVPAGVRIFPFALFVAIGFVFLSRLVGFQAPIMYGFVASAIVLGSHTMNDRQSALAVAVPAVGLLAIAIGAWLLLPALRDLTDANDDWWSYLPGEVAAILFAGGVEGLLFTMLPLQFTDGSKIWRSLRIVWFPLFAIPAFLFAWAILNPAAKDLDAVTSDRVIFALSLVAAYAAVAVAVWAFFLMRHRAHQRASA